jgi:hypothetical protein
MNGERIRDVGCDKFLRTFIKQGATVKLSIAKGWFTHQISAIQLPDGEILKGTVATSWVIAVQHYFLWLILLASGSYGLIYMDLWLVYFAWVFGMSAVITRFFTGFRFKARHALDNGHPPAAQPQQSQPATS